MNCCHHDAVCLACGRSDHDAPLLRLRYRTAKSWICADCLPQLIHDRDRLDGALSALVAGAAAD